jgi:hypothetical protein
VIDGDEDSLTASTVLRGDESHANLSLPTSRAGAPYARILS